MTRNEILEFVNRHPLAFMATVDTEGKPRVRGMMTCRADEQGLLFTTGKAKDVFRQIRAAPDIELCYYAPGVNKQVRIAGRAEMIEDRATREFVVEKFPFLKPWVEQQGLDVLGTFIVRKGRATAWTQDKAFEPKTCVDF